MPRRNSNTVVKGTKPRTTHVVVDTADGSIVDFGSKRSTSESAESANNGVGTYRYIIRPIHK